MSRRGRGRAGDHPNHERWLVSYADFITLLFALFVILYASSQADLKKFKLVAGSLKRAFPPAEGPGESAPGGTSDREEGNAGAAEVAKAAGDAKAAEAAADVRPAAGALAGPGSRVQANAAPEADPGLRQLHDSMTESLSLEPGTSDVADQVTLEYDARGLLVTIAAPALFPTGATAVGDDLRPLLDRIGRVLAKAGRVVRIEGHTDRSEARSRGYPEGGWELSSARAAWVARYWIDKFRFDPKRLGVAGYASTRPVTTRQDAWGQGKNRRIEIVVLREKPAP